VPGAFCLHLSILFVEIIDEQTTARCQSSKAARVLWTGHGGNQWTNCNLCRCGSRNWKAWSDCGRGCQSLFMKHVVIAVEDCVRAVLATFNCLKHQVHV
jgi:hypothetical protein